MDKLDLRSYSPAEVRTLYRRIHKDSDVDSGPLALHHTLGLGSNQAAPGGMFKSRFGDAVEWTDDTVTAGGHVTGPALLGSTTAPDRIGNNNDAITEGAYHRIGNMCFGWVRYIWGTLLTSAGSGNYWTTLPFPIDSRFLEVSSSTGYASPIGTWEARDDNGSGSVSDLNGGLVIAQTAGSSTVDPIARFIYLDGGSSTTVTNAIPWAWGDRDGISLNFAYPIASGY